MICPKTETPIDNKDQGKALILKRGFGTQQIGIRGGAPDLVLEIVYRRQEAPFKGFGIFIPLTPLLNSSTILSKGGVSTGDQSYVCLRNCIFPCMERARLQ